MRLIDRQYLADPFYGSRKLAHVLGVNRKRVQRLMRVMGLEAIYPKRRTTRRAAGHKIYPYLLRNLPITRPDQVWSQRHHLRAVASRLFIPGGGDGLVQPLRALLAVVEHAGRHVLYGSLGGGAGRARPEIFNTDQGSQFTAVVVHGTLGGGGRGDQHGRPRPRVGQRVHRAVVAEREVRGGVPEGLRRRLASGRLAVQLLPLLLPPGLHQSLGYRTPAAVYHENDSRDASARDENNNNGRKKTTSNGTQS